MKLSDLCKLNSLTKDIYVQNDNLSQFYHSIKHMNYKDIIANFSTSDLEGLSIYCKCEIISIYEYICNITGVSMDEGINAISKNLVCPMEENSFYLCNKELTGNHIYAEKAYKHALSQSIEPFRSHGIIATEFNFAV